MFETIDLCTICRTMGFTRIAVSNRLSWYTKYFVQTRLRRAFSAKAAGDEGARAESLTSRKSPTRLPNLIFPRPYQAWQNLTTRTRIQKPKSCTKAQHTETDTTLLLHRPLSNCPRPITHPRQPPEPRNPSR